MANIAVSHTAAGGSIPPIGVQILFLFFPLRFYTLRKLGLVFKVVNGPLLHSNYDFTDNWLMLSSTIVSLYLDTQPTIGKYNEVNATRKWLAELD